ncbi:GATA transcription factor 2-like isoform X2 [Rhododendron vialii]|uniref:GATA transcription factor 2-like isoform X2 n=1 Tax=Rhododendron vialii TaxID=182163 RepID=UPI00265E8363|nr:GATA transcription factor 2-like isoform X2 [Rhododendron vialii]
MDFCRNIPVPGGGLTSEYQPEQLLSPSTKLGSLDDLFSSHNMEGDMGLEWLSIYVEDCFSSSGNCLPPAPVVPTNYEPQKTATDGVSKASKESNPLALKKTQQKYLTTCGSSLRKARSQRKRGGSSVTKTKTQFSNWSHFNPTPLLDQISSDPPLLQQAYWLADSELILPKKDRESGGRGGGGGEEGGAKEEEVVEEEEGMGSRGSLEGSNGQQPRRCSHCLSQRTPQWRAGPKGPKTLCNACGVRYKSGRLLPEYRPAKSPTFVSYKHSNSHRKVLEMRNMSLLLSSNS